MEGEPSKTRLYYLWWLFKPDRLFLFLLAASITIFVIGHIKAEPGNSISLLLPKLAVLSGAVLMFAALATIGARLDRRHLDDYLFQIMANGAVTGIITTLFVYMLWLIGDAVLPPITRNDLIGVMLGSWAMGYFFYRWRGLNS